MVDRGFGLQLEDSAHYGVVEPITEFNEHNLDWWSEADSANFKLNDKPVTKSGSSRMNKVSRAGVIKPTGNTKADADLQRFAWYWKAYLDHYKYTINSQDVHIHEFWGGENKKLQSFRAVSVVDQLKKYVFGLLCDSLKFEVSDESMSVEANWVYKTEHSGIIGRNGETFTKPAPLENDLFLMFYDIGLELNNQPMTGIGTNLTFEGKNNLAVDNTIGFGSRAPQASALAQKRENTPSVTITLTEETIESILKAEYGKVGSFEVGDSGAYEPAKCTILEIPFGINVRLCEYPDLEMKILFPMCTLAVEYDMSGADAIDATISMETLGSNEVTLNDGITKVQTDMYVLLKNNQRSLTKSDVIFDGSSFQYNEEGVTVTSTSDGILVTNISEEVTGKVYSANKPGTGSNVHDWEAPFTIEGDIVGSTNNVRLQLFESSESYVSRSLEQLGIANGGTFKITYDGTTVNYYVNNSIEPVYSVEKTFSEPVEIRFHMYPEGSFIYRQFVIYQDEDAGNRSVPGETMNLNLNRNISLNNPFEENEELDLEEEDDDSPTRQVNPETVNIRVCVTDENDDSVARANVSIDEITSTTGSAGGCTLQNVPIGSQTITVTAEGFEDYTETIEVTLEKTEFEITLTEV